jgi:hypothetical protein
MAEDLMLIKNLRDHIFGIAGRQPAAQIEEMRAAHRRSAALAADPRGVVRREEDIRLRRIMATRPCEFIATLSFGSVLPRPPPLRDRGR